MTIEKRSPKKLDLTLMLDITYLLMQKCLKEKSWTEKDSVADSDLLKGACIYFLAASSSVIIFAINYEYLEYYY